MTSRAIPSAVTAPRRTFINTRVLPFGTFLGITVSHFNDSGQKMNALSSTFRKSESFCSLSSVWKALVNLGPYDAVVQHVRVDGENTWSQTAARCVFLFLVKHANKFKSMHMQTRVRDIRARAVFSSFSGATHLGTLNSSIEKPAAAASLL